MVKKPVFQVLQDGKTASWYDQVESIKVTDGIKDFVDTAEITLLNKDLPAQGEKIKILFGFGDELWDMGTFTVAVVTSGNESKARLKCHSSAFNTAIKTKRDLPYLQFSLQQIVRQIAKRNGLKSECDIQYKYDYIKQDNLSDLEFLAKLEKDHDALFNIKSDAIVLRQKNKGKLIKDASLTISGNDCTYSITKTSKDFYRSVEVSWQNTKTNSTERVIHGQGEPTLKIQRQFDSITEAKAYAQSQYQRYHNNTISGKITCEARPIYAGYIIQLKDAGDHSRDYLAEQVIHTLGKSYTCEITLQGI